MKSPKKDMERVGPIVQADASQSSAIASSKGRESLDVPECSFYKDTTLPHIVVKRKVKLVESGKAAVACNNGAAQ